MGNYHLCFHVCLHKRPRCVDRRNLTVLHGVDETREEEWFCCHSWITFIVLGDAFALFLPSAYPLSFIFPHLFCFKNIKYWSAAFFLLVVILSAFLGSITILPCSCFSSFRTEATTGSPNNYIALDTWYWVSIIVIIKLRITLSCFLGPQWIFTCRSA